MSSSAGALGRVARSLSISNNRHIDGHGMCCYVRGRYIAHTTSSLDFFWAMSELIDSAKQCVMILDWWLSPELYLRRPPAYYPEWRIDRLLHRKAEQGVKIYIIVYKEVTQTMSLSSNHTKHHLMDLHPNILVLVCPILPRRPTP
jgi:phosphatidylserine/phosphatidylglycerophosphate/cardiolipin synthase-like enzyme